MPMRSATTDELPCAMLPNGPACTRTGVFSSVCIRLGFNASRMITAMAPAPLPHLREGRGEREDRHHLAGGGDVEAGLAWHAVQLAAEAHDDVAQRAVVDVEHAPPGDV